MPIYTSYILRVWRAQEGPHWICRAMLEHVSTGRRTGFADLPSLMAFLQAESEAEATHAAAKDDHQKEFFDEDLSTLG